MFVQKKFFFYNSNFSGLSNNIIFANTLFLKKLSLRWLLLKMAAFDLVILLTLNMSKFLVVILLTLNKSKKFSSHIADFEQ